MPRSRKRYGCEHGEDDPSEPCYRERLMTSQATGLNAEKAQTRTGDQADADGEKVAARRGPFTEHEGCGKGDGDDSSKDQDEDAKVMPDDAQIVKRESLPHELRRFACAGLGQHGSLVRCRGGGKARSRYNAHAGYGNDKGEKETGNAQQDGRVSDCGVQSRLNGVLLSFCAHVVHCTISRETSRLLLLLGYDRTAKRLLLTGLC